MSGRSADPKNILMVSAECAPFAKVGGLGDVVQALSDALGRRGCDVRIVLPLYAHLDRRKLGIKPLKKISPLSLRVGQRMHDVVVHLMGSPTSRVKTYLIECPDLFGRPGIYADGSGAAFADAAARYALHCQAALLLPRLLEWPADIVHAHDAQAVPALLYRRQWYAGRGLPGPGGTVLTIHNLAHQEIHPPEAADTLGLPRSQASYPGLLEFHGRVNLMKAGILAADRVNTVSPTYARETTADPEFGCGLEGILAGRGEHYCGILNGADDAVWNPLKDRFLAANYGPGDLSGKAACRAALAAEVGLDLAEDEGGPRRPVCGFVGRLVRQKGIDLLLPVLDRLAADGFRFVILGTGDADLERATRAKADRLPGALVFRQEFDEGLAHRIYAGSDLFLMPSLFEPCGLSQLYALRYGTPPVVRRTGGLADTVIDADLKGGTGFVFDEPRSDALLAALRRAEGCWEEPERWRGLQAAGMACDFGWEAAAAAYEALYDGILAGRRDR